MVLTTVVASKEPKENADFFPLSVEYREKFYAAGKIPGGFFRREGKQREKEILTSRLIDRPIRPLFPEGFFHEVQLVATVISADKINDPDVLAIIGASAALDISDIPFDGPVAGIRIAKVEDKLLVNPTAEQIEHSKLNVIIVGTDKAITMIEGECKEVSEQEMIDVLVFAHEEIKRICTFLKKFRAKCGKPKRQVVLYVVDAGIKTKVNSLAKEAMNKALTIADKTKRQEELQGIRKDVLAKMEVELGETFAKKAKDVKMVLEEIEMLLIREKINKESIRPDGRKFDEIRLITCETGLLPRTHGSGLFTRGQTQALVVVTLGSEKDAQMLDDLEGISDKYYMLQYNFPPFSVGEVKPMRGPGRREIGHGVLAERAIKFVIPEREDFPYTIQVVSDILESNGSSSMATVCGATLALMDAGVPIKKPVAGIAMGLIKEGDNFIILTDIQGAEDHFGDMDFKIAGTKDGITAIQMDIKINGVSVEIMTQALQKAKAARLFILDRMNETISTPRTEMSPYAPKMTLLTISKEKIRDLIGPGGKNIKRIIEETGAMIDIEQDGTVRIFAENEGVMKTTIDKIKGMTAEAEIGVTYTGRVTKIIDGTGAIVEVIPGEEGLCHISEIAEERVNEIRDFVKEGDEFTVKVMGIEEKMGKKRIKLSHKQVLRDQKAK